MKIDIPQGKKIILFDGVCDLCNGSVIKVINNDAKNVFMFAAIQSEVGMEITNFLGIDTSKVDSIILYVPNEAYYTKSTAALKIINEFSGFWKLMQIFMILPHRLRDFIYDFVAKNRYKWFGKRDSCMIPSPQLKSKFL